LIEEEEKEGAQVLLDGRGMKVPGKEGREGGREGWREGKTEGGSE